MCERGPTRNTRTHVISWARSTCFINETCSAQASCVRVRIYACELVEDVEQVREAMAKFGARGIARQRGSTFIPID
jgi:hypothetical protein